jgi:hypothetical protein
MVELKKELEDSNNNLIKVKEELNIANDELMKVKQDLESSKHNTIDPITQPTNNDQLINKIIEVLTNKINAVTDIMKEALITNQQGGGIGNVIQKYTNIVKKNQLNIIFKQKYIKYKSKYLHFKQNM